MGGGREERGGGGRGLVHLEVLPEEVHGRSYFQGRAGISETEEYRLNKWVLGSCYKSVLLSIFHPDK